MTGRTCLLMATTAICVVSGGCGSAGTTSYTLEASRGCLSSLGTVTPQSDLDVIAEKASGGAMGVRIGGNDVSVIFHRTTSDAKRTLASLKLFADAFKVPADDILKRRGNVVLEWTDTPTGQQSDRVENCLA